MSSRRGSHRDRGNEETRGTSAPAPVSDAQRPLNSTARTEGGRSDFARGLLDDDAPPLPAIVTGRGIEMPPPAPPAEEEAVVEEPEAPAAADEAVEQGEVEGEAEGGEDAPKRRRRRGRRGGRRHRRRKEGDETTAEKPRESDADDPQAAQAAETVDAADVSDEDEDFTLGLPGPSPTEAAYAGLADSRASEPEAESDAADEARSTLEAQPDDAEQGRGRRRRRRGGRGRGRGRRREEQAAPDAEATSDSDDSDVIEVIEPPAAPDEADDEVHDLEEDAPLGGKVEMITDPHRSSVREGREMLINMADVDECRIATLSNGRLDELYMERVSSASHVGNIYKGRVTNVEPSIQAAFIDFGLSTHGFLHISDLHPQYFPNGQGETEQVGRKTPRRERPPIQRCLRKGQEVIVQITKEGIGTKGPTLTTYISVPGRFLVMMPGMNQLGVSRKIEDEDTRRELRDILMQLTLPKEMGFIMRTAAIGRTKRDLQRDLAYLVRLWRSTEERIRTERAPCELYQESDLVIRTIRDVFDADVKRIVCDHGPTAQRIADFLAIASPKSQHCVYSFAGREPIFHLYNIELEIEKLHSKHVPLPCGGSLVIEPTEALVAIDVNSGRFRVPDDPEETAYRVNLEAADEIARQLRLRDLGGLIICDFIDMRLEKHKRSLERRLRDALKTHKERAKCLKISKFGIIEMTRQRQRPSISRSIYQDCPRCRGTGMVKTPESVSLDVMRAINSAAHLDGVAIIDIQVSPTVANYLLNRKRRTLAQLETDSGRTLLIRGVEDLAVDEVRYSCTDRRGREIPFKSTPVLAAEATRGFERPPPPPLPLLSEGEGARDSAADDQGGNREPWRGRGNGRGRRRGRRRGGRGGRGENSGERG